MAEASLEKVLKEHTLVIAGDTPLIGWQSLKHLIDFHINLQECGNDFVYKQQSTAHGPTGCCPCDNAVLRIVEQKDATDFWKTIQKSKLQGLMSLTMLAYLKLWRISTPTMLSEYYITDVIRDFPRSRRESWSYCTQRLWWKSRG